MAKAGESMNGTGGGGSSGGRPAAPRRAAAAVRPRPPRRRQPTRALRAAGGGRREGARSCHGASPPAPVTAPGPRQERAGVPSALGHFRRAGPHRAVLPAGNAFGADTNPDGDSCTDVIKGSKGFQRPHYAFPSFFPLLSPPPPVITWY